MTTKNHTGSRDALGDSIRSLDDRLRQLASITPGSKGGGSVAAPFKIGDYTFGPGEQVDTTKLADIARPGDRWDAEYFSPIISQGASTNIAYDKELGYSEVRVDPGEVVWNFHFFMTGAGSAGSAVTLTLPHVAFRSDRLTYVGQGQIYDDNAATRYGLEAETREAGTLVAFGGGSTGGSLWGATPSLALAADDQIRGWFRYRPRNSG